MFLRLVIPKTISSSSVQKLAKFAVKLYIMDKPINARRQTLWVKNQNVERRLLRGAESKVRLMVSNKERREKRGMI